MRVRVRDPVVLALIVHVRTPLPLVFNELLQVLLLPAELLVTEAVVATPEITTSSESLTVIVHVELVAPSAATPESGEQLKLDLATLGT